MGKISMDEKDRIVSAVSEVVVWPFLHNVLAERGVRGRGRGEIARQMGQHGRRAQRERERERERERREDPLANSMRVL